MESNSYQVHILHIWNPHLLWAVDITSKDMDNVKFEQIGIYGLLPQDMTIDYLHNTLRSTPSDEWAPVVIAEFKKLVKNATEIWFTPIHITRRSSIFHDKSLKFGEITVKTLTGECLKLSQHLSNLKFAMYNASEFIKFLDTDKSKIELTKNEIEDVVSSIQKSICDIVKQKDNLKKQTHSNQKDDYEEKMHTCSRDKQITNLSLTTENLKKHDRIYNKQNDCMTSFEKIKQLSKMNTLSVKSEQTSTVSNLDTFQYLKAKESSSIIKNVKKDGSTSRKSDIEINSNHSTVHSRYDDIKRKTQSLKMDVNKDGNVKQNINAPINDDKDMRYVACGPPNFNISQLVVKKIPIISKDVKLPPKKEIIDTYIPKNEDLYADVDSVISVQRITESKPVSNNDNKSSNENEKNYGITSSRLTNLTNYNIHNNTLQQNKLKSFNDNQSYKENEFNQNKKNIDNESSVYTNLPNHNNRNNILAQNRSKAQLILKKLKEELTVSPNFLSISKSSVSDKADNTDETLSETEDLLDRLDLKWVGSSNSKQTTIINETDNKLKPSANPFKNIDLGVSVIVDNLVQPVFMVHSKHAKKICPVTSLRDLGFSAHILSVLKNLRKIDMMRLQTISWHTILSGHSLFMVSPRGSGKTIGYIPAICRLISGIQPIMTNSNGPICIIVCGTSYSVNEVYNLCSKFITLKERILSFFAGMDELKVTTSLLNGCDILVCTPTVLVRLLHKTDFNVDLKRLTTLVFDDCERLFKVYNNEIKYINIKVKETMKNRVDKEIKIQYILASRIWCESMETLAKKAPDAVICIGAHQECVLYSKCSTTISFVKQHNKFDALLQFLSDIDKKKKTVIVCTSDNEIQYLKEMLKKMNFVIYSCDNTMNIQELYALNKSWAQYEEPVMGPILLCCDGNLTHLNICDAHYLVHYSLPHLYSMFCKRFSVLNENYSSIWTTNVKNDDSNGIKIKIIIDEGVNEQIPKILGFIKRCNTRIPEVLEAKSQRILADKDINKAKNLIPICDNLMTLSECEDFWYCNYRHAFLKDFDQPKDWLPKSGSITFKILHYHTAVWYSAKLLSSIYNNSVVKYPQNFEKLALKLGLYYSKEANKRLHFEPKVGDICAVSLNQNVFARCQIIKILSNYKNGQPDHMCVKLIDEERYETTRDVNLFHLPQELKSIEPSVIQVRLANIRPLDKDITFSSIAKNEIINMSDDQESYLRGKICLVIGNCIFVDNIEVCNDLSSLNEVIIKYDFKQHLIGMHGTQNPDHISELKKKCEESGIEMNNSELVSKSVFEELSKPDWSCFEDFDYNLARFASTVNPDRFFIRLVKFDSLYDVLTEDIKKYIEEKDRKLNMAPKIGDIVLAQFPDEPVYERAIVDDILDHNTAKCFFVDQGDWANVSLNNIAPITNEIITRLPFQAIECRLVGVKPISELWNEFTINWFNDYCERKKDEDKSFYVKYCSKEQAEFTNGYKYSIIIYDTHSEEDIVLNEFMISLNLAQANPKDYALLEENIVKKQEDKTVIEESPISQIDNNEGGSETDYKHIKSVPSIESDDDSDENKWDFVPGNEEGAFSKFVENVRTQLQLTANTTNNKCKSTNGSKLSLSSEYEEVKSHKDQEEHKNINSERKDIVLRKPRICWHQTKMTVTVKILLLGVQVYRLNIASNSIEFSTNVDDVEYGFDLALYGAVDSKRSTHSNRGQYLIVNLIKKLHRPWLDLSRDMSVRKWATPDVDHIDTSSDEETVDGEAMENIVKSNYYKEPDSSDEEFCDDVDYGYNRN